jgi:hypothetical protein
MDWCNAYLTPQALSKYIYLSPPLFLPTIKLQYKTDQTHFHSLLYNFTAIINPNLDLEQKQ